MAQVLIIEDDKFLTKIYKTKLEKDGIEVEFAPDGEVGLEKMRSVSPKVALLDLVMPKMDGFQVLERVQQDADLKKIPILVLSNLGQDEDIQKAKSLGAKDFIVKSDTSIQSVVDRLKPYLAK